MKYKKVNRELIDKDQTFIQISSNKWKPNGYISLELFNELMDDSGNVRLYESASSDILPEKLSSTSLNLKVDDNFLYVKVHDKWKRIPLSNF